MSSTEPSHWHNRTRYRNRCAACRFPTPNCICVDLPTVCVQTRIVVLMHHREWWKKGATAPLAELVLTNSQILIRGRQDAPLCADDLCANSGRALVLFPSADAKKMFEANPESVVKKADAEWEALH